MPRVVVMGVGYVGFPLVCALAQTGQYGVAAYDIDEQKIARIQQQLSPLPGDESQILKEVSVHATREEDCFEQADFIVICVPTPVDEHKRPDLGPVESAARTIARHLKKGQIIILESTVNPGISEEVVLPILESTGLVGGIDFELAHCPERINPGDEYWTVHNIPRNVGALTPEGTHAVAEFYRSFLHASVHEVSSIKAAEATKIVENAFRDVNIAYVNELAQLFDRMGIDIMEVLQGASNKPFAFLRHYPGCGVGGHCIPVDPYYLIDKARDMGFDHRLLKIARSVNNGMPHYTVEKLVQGLATLGIPIVGARVGLLGLSYKANIGDMRESPALEIKKELVRRGAVVLSCDPYCNGHADARIEEILETCIGLILATDHQQFKEVKDWGKVQVVIDGRNCLDMKALRAQNIYYRGIGRGG